MDKWITIISLWWLLQWLVTVAIGNPSGKCAKLHTVAASNNRDHASQSLLWLLVRATHIYVVVLRAHPVRGESYPPFYNEPHRLHVLCVKAEPGTTFTSWSQHDFVAIGNPSSKCTKLHNVAASNNRDYAFLAISLIIACSRHGYILLFFAHIPFVVDQWITHSTQRHRRGCTYSWAPFSGDHLFTCGASNRPPHTPFTPALTRPEISEKMTRKTGSRDREQVSRVHHQWCSWDHNLQDRDGDLVKTLRRKIHQKLRDGDSRHEVRNRDSRLQNMCILPNIKKKFIITADLIFFLFLAVFRRALVRPVARISQ